MRTVFLCLAMSVLAVSAATAADPPLVDGVSGAPLAWGDWLPRKGPVAVLVWTSWAPDAETVMDRYEGINEACAEAGLFLVILDVQESLEDGRSALGPRGVNWIHDRHGALLKTYRIIKVPSLLLLSADGETLGKIDASAEAVLNWKTP